MAIGNHRPFVGRRSTHRWRPGKHRLLNISARFISNTHLDLIVSIGARAGRVCSAASATAICQYAHGVNGESNNAGCKPRALLPMTLSSRSSITCQPSSKISLRLLPDTKAVTVINGTSPLEQFWLGEMRKEFKQFERQIDFAWTSNLSFDDILKRAAALPPHSVIFWELMIVDAAGTVHQGDKALAQLHEIANAPIFSFDDSFFGSELVGGPMHSVLEVSQRTAEVAIRILGGEKPGEIKTPPLGFATPKYDWGKCSVGASARKTFRREAKFISASRDMAAILLVADSDYCRTGAANRAYRWTGL